MISAGIDGGSRAVKVVVMDVGDGADADARKVLASGVTDQGLDHEALALALFEEVLASKGMSRREVDFVVATGHARKAVAFADTTVTEITCHAAGVRDVVPGAATIVEIGGQDSKVISLDADGAVRDFAMNDRCAAGTGCFLEMAASRLGVGVAEIGGLAAAAESRAVISSMCAVFAETEIIGLLASGVRPEAVAAGVAASISSRVAAMAGRRTSQPVVFTGGVAMIAGMAGALSEALGCPVEVAPDPQMTGALGAAIIAGRRLSSRSGRWTKSP